MNVPARKTDAIQLKKKKFLKSQIKWPRGAIYTCMLKEAMYQDSTMIDIGQKYSAQLPKSIIQVNWYTLGKFGENHFSTCLSLLDIESQKQSLDLIFFFNFFLTAGKTGQSDCGSCVDGYYGDFDDDGNLWCLPCPPETYSPEFTWSVYSEEHCEACQTGYSTGIT